MGQWDLWRVKLHMEGIEMKRLKLFSSKDLHFVFRRKAIS